MGAEAIQVHPTPPNYWGSPKLDDERVERFREAAEAAGRPPFYFHAVYLINLAGDDPTLRQQSESTLAGYLAAADRLGISGVIFGTASQTGLGANRDRHANIGQGAIGEDGLAALLHDPRLARVPFILEVPGFDGKGPDAANLEILRRLAGAG